MNIQMIAVSNCNKSRYYSEICIRAWEDLDYDVHIFEATTPATLTNALKFSEKKFNGNPFTEIEKAIWESHYRLWSYVVRNGPTYIIEHDTYPTKKLPEFSGAFALFSIFPRNDEAWQGRKEVLSPGSGYYIDKMMASLLIDYAVSREINQNVDGHIFQTLKLVSGMKTVEFEKYWCDRATCFQLVNYDVGTSAEHNV